MRTTNPQNQADETVRVTEMNAATYKRVHAETLRKYSRAFKLLAAYDRGEYTIPSLPRR